MSAPEELSLEELIAALRTVRSAAMSHCLTIKSDMENIGSPNLAAILSSTRDNIISSSAKALHLIESLEEEANQHGDV